MKALKFGVFILALFMVSCSGNQNLEEVTGLANQDNVSLKMNQNERVVVANRVSGTISVIDAQTNGVIGTYTMPDGGEPMYVVHIPQAKKVFVGDRANNRVIAFNEDDFTVEGTVPCGNGVFHMWASANGSQLWVNNDIDKTTTVINPASMMVKGTAVTPADLAAMGGKPHDVFLDPSKKFAYVSVLGVAGANDYIVKYNTNKYEEVGRAAVGQDPHISATSANNLLYVPCQNTSNVYVLNRDDLSVVAIVPFAGAHGAGMSNSGDYFYTADISGARIGVLSTSTNSVVGTPLSTPFPVPHNLAINSSDTKLFVTHSGGTADKLSIYAINPEPTLMTSVTVGLNPFGLVYYSY